MNNIMKNHLLPLMVLLILLIALAACTSTQKTFEDALKELNLDENSYTKLPDCEQIRIFAEVGYQFMDTEHMYVNVPRWMYDSIKQHETKINASCISEQILKYLLVIDNDANQYKTTSLKIHALIYLSKSLELIADQDIIKTLESLVCEKRILNYENFIVTYFLAKTPSLPSYFSGKPEDLNKLWIEACQN